MKDGTVVTWGDKVVGGDCINVVVALREFDQNYSTEDVFAETPKD